MNNGKPGNWIRDVVDIRGATAMSFLILEKDKQPYGDSGKQYKGTDRSSPLYIERFPHEHPVNQIVLSFAQEGEGKFATDIEQAVELIRLYRMYNDEEFELIETVHVGEAATMPGDFLGWDVSLFFGESHIWNGICRSSSNYEAIADSLPWGEEASRFTRLMDLYFTPRLNQNGLFDLYEDAVFYRDCHDSIQSLQPGCFEYGEFEILGIYRCRIDNTEDDGEGIREGQS